MHQWSLECFALFEWDPENEKLWSFNLTIIRCKVSLSFSGSSFIDLNVKWWNANVMMLAKMQRFNMSLSKYYLSSASRGFFVVLNFKNVVVTALWIHKKFIQRSFSNYSSMYKSTWKKGCTKKTVPKNKTSVCIFYMRF